VLFRSLYLKTPVNKEPVREAPLALLLPTWALVLASIWFGIDADLTVATARSAAESLLGGGYGGDAIIMGREGRL